MDKKKLNRFLAGGKLTRNSHSEASNFYQKRLDEIKQLVDYYRSVDPEAVDLRIPNNSQSIEKIGIVFNMELKGIDLLESHIKELVVVDCIIADMNCINSHLESFVLINSTITSSTFSHTIFDQIMMRQVVAKDIKFSKSTLNNAWLEGDFAKCKFDNSTLEKAILKGDFTSASFKGANLQNSWLREAMIVGASFKDANIRGIRLDLVEPSINSVEMPDGSLHVPITNDFYKFSK